MLRVSIIILAVVTGLKGQTTSDFQETIRAAMAGSLEKQKASIRVQAGSATHTVVNQENIPAPAPAGFYSVDWPTPPQFAAASSNSGGRAFVDCDPMPEDDLGQIIKSASEREGISADLVRQVIRKESAAKPCAISPVGAQGLMQLMPGTADELGVRDALDPRQNVEAGAKLLKRLLTRYNGDIALALGAYNAGSGAVDREGGVPKIPETLNYVTDILSHFRVEE